MKITIPHNYIPRLYQQPLYNSIPRGFKRGYAVWHRRAGKDKTFVNILTREALKRKGIYYYVLPYYKQARMIIWEGMDSAGFKFINHIPQEIIGHKDNQQMVIELINGSLIRFIGSDNIDSIVGTNPIGLLMSEFPLQKPEAWNYLSPILLENGGWALFNGTPRGKNHAYQLFMAALRDPKHWFTEVLTVKDTFREDGTPIVTDEDLDRERARGIPEEIIQQEYFCSWDAGMAYAYYSDQMAQLTRDGKITTVPYNPNHPVITGWDLGFDDENVIWFAQRIGRELLLIDLHQNRSKPIPYYVNVLNNKPYCYGQHYMPHDVEHHEYSSGDTRFQTFVDNGIPAKLITTVEKMRTTGAYIPEAISLVRSVLPRCVFDLTHCFDGIEAMRSYRRAYDEAKDKLGDSPVSDWTKHYADAFRTLCQGVLMDADNESVKSAPFVIGNYEELDNPYNELYDYLEEDSWTSTSMQR